MTTCTRCAISAWHPEAASCTIPDCDLRGRQTTLPATANETRGRTFPGGGNPAAGDFVEESAPLHAEGIAA